MRGFKLSPLEITIAPSESSGKANEGFVPYKYWCVKPALSMEFNIISNF